jgi:hypothetical protein
MNNSENIQDYTETEEEARQGHEDTRHKNFGCEHPLGCDPGVDVAG